MSDDLARTNPESTPGTPFVGLVPYGEDDAAFFFGRDRETQIVAGNLRAASLTLLYGASGVGKTSLLRAGVVRDLRRQLHEMPRPTTARAPFSICVFSDWRDDPTRALLETIRISAVEALGDGDLPRWRPGDSIAETLRSWTERVRTLLVVLDQFEDYFLYHPDDAEGTLMGELPAIVNDPELRVHLMLSIREDALAKLDRFKGTIPRLFANYIRVEHLDRAAARRAIEGPVAEWNRRSPDTPPYALEPGLVEAVLDAAAIGRLALVPRSVGTDATADGRYVEAPFLQLVMDRLWRETVAAEAHALTLSRLDELGGPQRIVENHLLDALGALTSDEQAVAADLFRFLVTRSKTKIAHQVTDLAEWTGRSEPEVATVLDELCRGESGRILRRIPPPAGGEGDTRYELFHDVLAEPILDWRREYEQEERRRATVRRFLRVGGILASLVAVFAALGIWALVQRSEAQSATRSATSLALASAASAQVDDHVEQSLLLGLEALREKPTAEATSAMVGALEVARSSGAKTILRGGADGVRAIAYSSDGSTLASADFDGTLRLWDTKGSSTLGEPLVGHTSQVWSLAFSPDGTTLASASFDGTVRLWSAQDGSPLGEPIAAGVGLVRAVAFSPDGRTIAFGGQDDVVRLWDVRDEEPMGAPLRGHRSGVYSVAFSPDGRTLASGGEDGIVRVWDLRNPGRQGRALEGHTGEVASVAFSPDGRLLASSDLEGEIRLWDARTLAPLGGPRETGTGEVWSVAFSPDGRTLAWSGYDGTVRSLSVRSREAPAAPLRGHSRAVIAVAYAPDGTLASSSFDGTVRLWDRGTARPLGAVLGVHEDRVTAVSFSPDGSTLASGGFDQAVRLWALQERGGADELGDGRTDAIESVAFSPDGRTLAAADVDGSIWLWGTPSGSPAGRLSGHDATVQSIAFGPDGDVLASGGDDGTVRLWSVAQRSEIGVPLTGHEDAVLSVAFSSDGRTIASSSSDTTLRLWDVREHAYAGELPLADAEVVEAVAFGPDGETLASGSSDGAVRLWDTRARLPLGEPLDGHAGQGVEDLAFRPDGLTLVTGGSDGSVQLWDVAGRRALGEPLEAHGGGVFGVAFSPDGRTVASGGDDETVRLWEGILWSDLNDLETQVCDLVVRNFTEEEWQLLVPGLAYRTTCPT